MVSRKSKLSWTLTTIMLVRIRWFHVVGRLQQRIFNDFSQWWGDHDWGMPLGLSIIVLSFILLCACLFVYLRITNSIRITMKKQWSEVEAIAQRRKDSTNMKWNSLKALAVLG